MKKILLLLVTILSFGIANAQSQCQAYFSFQSNPGSNVVYLQGYAYSPDSLPINVLSWTWTISNAFTLSGQNAYFQANASGFYYVCLYIETDNNCTSTYCDTIAVETSNPCNLYLTGYVVNATSNSSNDGSINLSVYYGTEPYYYTWSNGAITQDIDFLAPGIYEVTVSDSIGCTASQYFSVAYSDSLPPDSLMQVWASTSDNTAAIGTPCNGTAYINVYGGTPPYTYYMNNGAVSGNYIEGLCAGTYTVIVTDATGVSVSSTFVIYDYSTPGDSLLYVNIYSGYSPNGMLCYGYAEADVWGGVAPYTYVWDNGETTNIIQNLCEGFYCVTVTDANGQNATGCVNISDYDSSYVYPEDTLNGQIDTCFTSMILDSAFVGGVFSNNTGVFVNWIVIAGGDTLFINQEYVIDTPGTYLITLVINCNGAKNMITLSDIYTVTQDELTITGITKPENNLSVSLYPNPVKDVLHINSAKTISGISIIDATGRTICFADSNTINMDNLAGGIYIVNIMFDDNSSIVKKIIK